MRYSIDDIVSQVNRLPMPNAAALQVIQLCADPEVKNSRLVEVVSTDQSLTAQVLKIANSSYFNFPRTIHTIDRALVILGMNLLKDISISIAFHSFFKGFASTDWFDFDYNWHHSLLTALICKTVSNKFTPNSGDIIYVGGLLHDIGKLVEVQIVPEAYQHFVEQSRQKSVRLYEVEQQELDFNHGDIGGILIDRWNLPAGIVNMITFHHYPGDFSGSPEEYHNVRLIYLSNILAHFFQDEFETLDDVLQFDANFLNYFPFSERDFSDLIAEVRIEIDKKQYLMEIQ